MRAGLTVVDIGAGTGYRPVLISTGQADCIAMLEAHIEHRATTESVTQMLEDAGFELAETATDSFRLRFADHAGEIFARLEPALNAVAARRGELVLTVPMAGFVARKPLQTVAAQKAAD